jgi:hypothetical protein
LILTVIVAKSTLAANLFKLIFQEKGWPQGLFDDSDFIF